MRLEECKEQFERIEKIATEYSFSCKEIYHELSKKIVRYEYGKDNECIHRGYYCPSKVLDIVIDGSKRGRLCKTTKTIRQAEIIFGFDKNDRLITIEDKGTCEYIIYKGNYQLGITFRKWEEIQICCISECYYNQNGSLHSYCAYQLEIPEMIYEEYEYYSDKLVVELTRCSFLKQTYLDNCKYYFLIDGEGYLNSYTVKESDEDGNIKPGYWDGHVFAVAKSKRRKV